MENLARQLIDTGRRLYENGLIAAGEGNMSIRMDENYLLATPGGVSKGHLTAEQLVKTDLRGNPAEPGKKPSSEIKLHLEVYRQRPDVNAVLHAHPPYVNSLTLAGFRMDKPYFPESALLLGNVPVAPYARPSTPQVPASISDLITQTDILILERHGSLTVGTDLTAAYHKLEILENTAKIIWLARQAGEITPLDQAEINEIMKLRQEVYGLTYRIIPFETDED